METQKPRTTPKDFFLYLGAIVALYTSTISILTLLFEIINQLFPKPFAYVDLYASGVSLAVAMLIVALPLYFMFMRITSRVEHDIPEKRELPVRKWLVYFTVFIAGAAIAIDLIVLLQTFFAGEEITLAFVLKVISIALVLTFVFGYYLYDIHHTPKDGSQVRIRFAYGVGMFAVLSMVTGFWVMGSPYTQKQKRFDAVRVSDLQMIQSQVVSYWQTKQKLPTTLDDLKDPLSGFTVPFDPESKAAYKYIVKEKFSFELCATFNKETPIGVSVNDLSRPISTYKDSIDENWQHKAGEECFKRTIDPERYKSQNMSVAPIPTF